MFKDKLKELRTQNGITQKDLADEIFVSRSAIAKWENGNGYPSEVNLEALCSYFGVEEEWLMERNDYKENIKQTKIKFKRLPIQIISIIIPLMCYLLTYAKTLMYSETLLDSFRQVVSMVNILKWNIIVPHIFIIAPIILSILDIIIIYKRTYSKYNKVMNWLLPIMTILSLIIFIFMARLLSNPNFWFILEKFRE